MSDNQRELDRLATSRPQIQRGGGPRGGIGMIEKPKNFKKALARLMSFGKKYMGWIIAAVIAAIISVALLVSGPSQLAGIADIIAKGIDKGNFAGEVFDQTIKMCVILAACYLGSGILHIFQEQVLIVVSQRITQKMRSEIDKKVNRLPLSYFDKVTFGDVLSRVTNDVDTIGQALHNSLALLVRQSIFLIGSLIMMFVTNYILGFSVVGSTLLGVVAMFIILNCSQKFFRQQQRYLGDLNGHVEEMYSGHNIVRVFNGTQEAIDKFEEYNEKLYTSAWKSQFLSGLMQPTMGFVGNLGYVVVCIVGGALVVSNHMSAATIVAFMLYVRFFTNPLSQIAQALTNFQSMAAASERVFEFLDAEEMPEEEVKQTLTSVKGDVDFDHVKFGYTSDKIIINDFCAHVKAGQKVAIVGPTGAGKTTIVNLLMRFYELNGGCIRIDGVPLTDLSRQNIHDLFGMVLQDTWIFEGTIIDNVRYSKTSATEEDVVKACKAVGLHRFIKTLPEGYHTVLDEKSGLSAGQKQLLTIARAIVEDAPMLILDEATSSVDTRTEVVIQQAMDYLTEKRTSFIIAHRLSTIKNADIILVLKDGDIIEQGNHKQLLDKNGFYAQLYNSQFQQ